MPGKVEGMARVRDSSELWICLNCMNVGPLTAHGRCETCDSDSVAVADTGQWLGARDEVAELERLFQLTAKTRLHEKPAVLK